jgi:hypothetical protein
MPTLQQRITLLSVVVSSFRAPKIHHRNAPVCRGVQRCNLNFAVRNSSIQGEEVTSSCNYAHNKERQKAGRRRPCSVRSTVPVCREWMHHGGGRVQQGSRVVYRVCLKRAYKLHTATYALDTKQC